MRWVLRRDRVKEGEYLVRLLPKFGANPDHTFTIDVMTNGMITRLVDSAPLSAIPILGHGPSQGR